MIPKEVEATFVPVGDVVNFEFHAFGQLKEQGLDILAWALAKEAINALTGDIIEWVNTGFNGNPAFVQSPYGYLQDIGDQTATDFIQQRRGFLGNAPFGDQVVQGLVYDYSKTYYSQPYDLDRYSSDPEAFLSGDFSKGGWNAWFGALNNPNNTFLGSYLRSKEAENVAINRVREEELLKLQWGDGFKSVEDAEGKILTPGTIIKDQLNETLGSGLRSLENADELSEVITALVGNLVQNVFSSTGLLGSSGAIAGSGGSSLTDLLKQATAEQIIGTQDISPLPAPSETPTSNNNPI